MTIANSKPTGSIKQELGARWLDRPLVGDGTPDWDAFPELGTGGDVAWATSIDSPDESLGFDKYRSGGVMGFRGFVALSEFKEALTDFGGGGHLIRYSAGHGSKPPVFRVQLSHGSPESPTGQQVQSPIARRLQELEKAEPSERAEVAKALLDYLVARVPGPLEGAAESSAALRMAAIYAGPPTAMADFVRFLTPQANMRTRLAAMQALCAGLLVRPLAGPGAKVLSDRLLEYATLFANAELVAAPTNAAMAISATTASVTLRDRRIIAVCQAASDIPVAGFARQMRRAILEQRSEAEVVQPTDRTSSRLREVQRLCDECVAVLKV